MSAVSDTLAKIVSDFDQLYDCYSKGGLIGENAGGDMAEKLVGKDIARFRREFLLVDALVRNRFGRVLGRDGGLRHMVVFGGNNVGKSTIVNIMAAEPVSSVSPEGGHTRHAQAFVQGGEDVRATLFRDNPYAFRRFTRHAHDGLARAPFDQYGVTPLTSKVLPPQVVLWDTPDCDAVGSERYLAAVIEAVAAADVLIYVTTSQKYSVDHLVEWFLLLHSAGIDVLECLNRTALRDQKSIIESQRTRHFPEAARRLGLPVPEPAVIGLKYMIDGEEEDLWDPEQHPQATQLREAALALLKSSNPARAAARALEFVIARTGALLDPARIEAEAIKRWGGQVDEVIAQFPTIYEQTYLASDKVIEPVTRLNVKILALLDPDIRGLKEALDIVNWVARWPSKMIITVFGHFYRVATGGSQQDAKKVAPEAIAYTNAHEFVLERLTEVIESARNAPLHHPFWDVLHRAWTGEFKALNDEFAMLIERHMRDTDRDIAQAAQDIFDRLKEWPRVLTALQSAKLAASVSGLAVTFLVPHAGIFVVDLLEEAVLGPLVLGGVDAATQSVVQGFVTTRKRMLIASLKARAASAAGSLYRAPLERITHLAMSKAGTLGVDRRIIDGLVDDLGRLRSEFHSFYGSPSAP